MPVLGDIHGTAIIDLVPLAAQSASEHILRADGRFLRVPATTTIKLEDQLTPEPAFSTNVWISYQGTLRKDGTVLVTTASLRKNVVKGDEQNLNRKSEYEPAAVSPDARQSGVSKFFLGLDVKRFPPHQDPELQARIERIGACLIPAY